MFLEIDTTLLVSVSNEIGFSRCNGFPLAEHESFTLILILACKVSLHIGKVTFHNPTSATSQFEYFGYVVEHRPHHLVNESVINTKRNVSSNCHNSSERLLDDQLYRSGDFNHVKVNLGNILFFTCKTAPKLNN